MDTRSPLWLGICLPFAIATAISLKNALAITVEFFAVNLFAVIITTLFTGGAPSWIRAAAGAGAATVAMVLTRALITLLMPDISNYLGTYVYLMALSGVMLLQTAETGAEKSRLSSPEPAEKAPLKLWPAIAALLNHIVIFAGLMLAVSLPREYFGNGTLWGRAVPAPQRLTGMQLPFFGFIIVAFVLALVRFIDKKSDTFGFIGSLRREARERARYRAIRVDTSADSAPGRRRS